MSHDLMAGLFGGFCFGSGITSAFFGYIVWPLAERDLIKRYNAYLRARRNSVPFDQTQAFAQHQAQQQSRNAK